MSYFKYNIIKDPDVDELTSKTSLRILEIMEKNFGHEPTTIPSSQINFVSFEQALSELITHERNKNSSSKE